MGIRGELYSVRSNTKSERRFYFFNVKENRMGDVFLNIVESNKHGDGDHERRQIVVFNEDLPDFLKALNLAAAAMKRNKDGNSSGGFRRGPSSSKPPGAPG